MIQKYGKRPLFPSQNRWRISCTLEVTATKTRVGSKRQNGSRITRREPTYSRGELANSLQKTSGWESHPGPSC
ncbi:hypothetical protein AMECASPLE_020990 [Ameca splendens]|uniref:Uncharacterized protein n=1 Tax=Ameca splendens TaxID=208324 RepID=A0ABV1A0K8_9TELE